MMHKNVYEWFKLYFPLYERQVTTWFPSGKNCIRVRQENMQEFIFTYNGPADWCFETIDSYLGRIKERKKDK